MMRRSLSWLLLFAPFMLQAADTPAPAAAPGPASVTAGAAPAAAAGARNAYRVEVILFRQAQAPGGGEDFGAAPENRGFGDKRDVGGGAPSLVRMLEDSELQLGAIAQKMRASGGVQVLAHKGWIQTATAWPRHVGLPIETFGINVPNLRGSFYLERGDLLHVGAYLQLGANPVYTLSELRKVRFNEKHYLDHPAFGLLVQVSPNR